MRGWTNAQLVTYSIGEKSLVLQEARSGIPPYRSHNSDFTRNRSYLITITMIIKILGVVGIAVFGLLIYAFFKSLEMQVVRDLQINATPDSIFSHLNDPKKSAKWTTWMDDDPNVVMNYSGPSEGMGSIASWKSTGMMGEGTAKIVESVVNHNVKTRMSFIKPMELSQLFDVSLVPSNGGTLVRLSMSWQNPFVMRLMCIFADMEKKMGGSFEKALTNLKHIAEGGGSK